MNVPDYTEINRHAWNNKTSVHITSAFYDNEAFLQGKSTLKNIELSLLGDVNGKSILHLQCHFTGWYIAGTDRRHNNRNCISLFQNAVYNI